jgi:N-acyl-L-homoserine lactone synthetase
MKYLEHDSLPPYVKVVVLNYQERDNPLYQKYMEIRDFHYTHKNQWEPEGGEDAYDCHSTFVIVTDSRADDEIITGCRIISDNIGLPVRDVLREHGLPTDQIPEGSCEISRFVMNPLYLNCREKAEYVRYQTLALEAYCREQKIPALYAVMISVVEKLLGRLGFKVTPLAEPAVVNHGDMGFRTVRFLEEERS